MKWPPSDLTPWTLTLIVTFVLSITYPYWTLAYPRVKKDEHLENQKRHFGSMYYFQLLDVSPFPPRGFFTFLIAVAHGAASYSSMAKM